MLLKVVYVKTAFLTFKILTLNKTLMKHIQNNQKTKENPYQLLDFKNLKKKICEPKVSMLWFLKENHTFVYGFKNLFLKNL